MNNILATKSTDQNDIEAENLTLDNIATALANDTKVKLAGLDIDGELDGLSIY